MIALSVCDEVKLTCGNCSRHFVDIEACDDGPRLPRRPDTSRPLAAAPSRPMSSARESRSSSSSSSDSSTDSDWRLALPTSLRADMLDASTNPDLKTAVFAGFTWQPASETNPTTNFYVPLILSDVVLQRLTVNFAHISAECIRLLRDRVENEASRVALGVSDQTISTVATLAAIEVCYSSVET
ncbi:hypothetical protein BDZ45DRAFT_744066 [Acephala macrosclerotiorum]|nr:hypothetical protein BDZ45DRAFT_744066 [Acephala macrosclerotiorum]